MFQRVSNIKTLVVGSLETEGGSEYLFGYDPDKGLKWLERHGQEFTSADPEWAQAAAFLAGRETVAAAPTVPVAQADAGVPRTVSRSMGQPKQVQRSVAGADGWEDPYPMEGDSRIVGDMSTSGKDIPDDDIAAQAETFLRNLGEE